MVNRLFGVTLMLLCLVCAASAGDDEGQIKAKEKAWHEAFNAGDAKALVALYAPDAMMLPPNAEPVKGRKSIEEFWAGSMEGVKGKLKIQEVGVLEVLVQGDLAYSLGRFTILDVDGKVVDRGKYVAIWKRADGQWRIYRDILNTSLPKPKPAQ